MCHALPRATPLARAPSCPPRRTIAAQLTPPDTASPPLSGQDIGQSAPKPAPEMASFDCLVFRDVEPRGAVAVPAHRKDLADPYPEPSQPLVRMGGPLGGRFKHIEDELYALRCVTRPGSGPSRPLEGQPGPPWRAVPRAPGRHARVRGALAPSGRPSRPPRSAPPLPSPPLPSPTSQGAKRGPPEAGPGRRRVPGAPGAPVIRGRGVPGLSSGRR